ncbi:MAG TPA: hypothetical protein VM573_04620 [Actinomycetota bacterium]|jgi:hypothetical protein|nr:hypothetical protein [Actinomycetota bacterium]
MFSIKTRRIAAALGAAVIAASLGASAVAAPKGPSNKGGKKPIGTIASFDSATGALAVDLKDGTQFTGTVTEDTKIKVDHRGKPGKKGNPTTGTTADLVPGYQVLRLKSDAAEDGSLVVEKVKVRKVAAASDDSTEQS